MLDIKSISRDLKAGRPPGLGNFPPGMLDFFAETASLRGKFSTLTNLERLTCCIRHKSPDRVPVTPLANSAARQILGISFPDYSQKAESAADCFMAGLNLLGGDMAVLLVDLSVEAEGFGQKIIYPLDSTARPDYGDPVVKSTDDYEKIRPVLLENSKRMKEFVKLCEIMVARCGFSYMVSGFVFGPLGVLAMMRGAEHLFKDCVLHPKKVMKALEAITETLCEFTQAQCDAGVGAIAIDTLFASYNGLSKELWEKIEGPFAREIAQVIKRNGRVVGIHNCGHGIYFDAQIRSMEPELISFAHLPDDCATERDLVERYGDSITLVGCVPTPLLIHGTPQEVMDESRRQIDVFGKSGGFVLAPGCEYPPNVPLVNALALVRAATS